MHGRPKNTKKDRLAIKEVQYIRLINLTKRDKLIKSTTRKKLLRAYTFLYIFGARISEITKLTKDDLHTIYTKKELILTKTKTNTMQRLIINEKGIAMLQDLDYSDCKECLFYKNNSDTSMSVSGLTKLINTYLKKYLNGLYTSHSFRAGFITRIIEMTGDIKSAQKLARHSDIKMTLRYQEVSDQRLNDVLDCIT